MEKIYINFNITQIDSVGKHSKQSIMDVHVFHIHVAFHEMPNIRFVAACVKINYIILVINYGNTRTCTCCYPVCSRVMCLVT